MIFYGYGAVSYYPREVVSAKLKINSIFITFELYNYSRATWKFKPGGLSEFVEASAFDSRQIMAHSFGGK